MSRYDADLERLATQLGRMAASPTVTAAATDIETVNRARVAIRRWCRSVLDDIAPAQSAEIAGQPGQADVARRPIGALQKLLRDDPQPLPPGELSSSDAGDAANEQWRQLAAAVEVVAHEWSSSDPTSRPTGEQAWATVADVAAVAEAASLLDRDLAAGISDTSVPGVRDRWEIAIAAEQVRQLAAGGPLLSAQPLRPAPHRLRPVPVRGMDTFAPALANLAALIVGARDLAPGTVGALAGTHAHTLRTLAKALAATGPPSQQAVRKQLSETLHHHADILLNIQVAGRPLQSLETDDPRPVLQMQEIRSGLRRLVGSRTVRSVFREDQPALLDSLAAALRFGPATATSVYAHIQAGRWLQPRANAQFGWQPVTPDAPIAEAAMLVQGQARTLAAQLPRARRARLPHRSPHEVLTPQLLRSDRRRGPSPTAAHGPTFGDIARGP